MQVPRHVPVPRPVERFVDVQVPQPYEVQQMVERHVQVPVPRAVPRYVEEVRQVPVRRA